MRGGGSGCVGTSYRGYIQGGGGGGGGGRASTALLTEVGVCPAHRGGGGEGGGCRELSQDCFHIRYPTYLGEEEEEETIQLPTPPYAWWRGTSILGRWAVEGV
jgi:hypothetical protein